jgi:hypothetical protein
MYSGAYDLELSVKNTNHILPYRKENTEALFRSCQGGWEPSKNQFGTEQKLGVE